MKQPKTFIGKNELKKLGAYVCASTATRLPTTYHPSNQNIKAFKKLIVFPNVNKVQNRPNPKLNIRDESPKRDLNSSSRSPVLSSADPSPER